MAPAPGGAAYLSHESAFGNSAETAPRLACEGRVTAAAMNQRGNTVASVYAVVHRAAPTALETRPPKALDRSLSF